MAYQGSSIVDYLKSVGQDSSQAARSKLAAQYGINDYKYTAEQNLKLLGMLRSGQAAPTAAPAQPSATLPTKATQPDTGTKATPAAPTPTAPTPEAPTSFQRDIAREAAAVKQFGKAPSSPQEMATYARFVYTPEEIRKMGAMDQKALNITPDQAKQVGVQAYNPAQLKAAGLTDAQIASLAPTGQAANAAQAGLANTPRPTNSALAVLQDALNAKKNVTNQALGTSELFGQAGLGGHAVLQQSLSQRAAEMETNYNVFKSTVSDMSGALVDAFNLATDEYKLTHDAYKEQVGQLLKINEAAVENEQKLKIMEKQAALNKEVAAYTQQQQAKYETISVETDDGTLILNKLGQPLRKVRYDGSVENYGGDAGGGSSAGGFTSGAKGMRTDRHNNPTAFTVDVAKTGGLKEGVDYTKGDPFDGGVTARIIGDPVEVTIRAIDKMGFYTQSGKQRWTHTAMPQSQWNAMGYDQKKNVIADMYRKEGGNGSLLQGGAQSTSAGSGSVLGSALANRTGWQADAPVTSGLPQEYQNLTSDEQERVNLALSAYGKNKNFEAAKQFIKLPSGRVNAKLETALIKMLGSKSSPKIAAGETSASGRPAITLPQR